MLLCAHSTLGDFLCMHLSVHVSLMVKIKFHELTTLKCNPTTHSSVPGHAPDNEEGWELAWQLECVSACPALPKTCGGTGLSSWSHWEGRGIRTRTSNSPLTTSVEVRPHFCYPPPRKDDTTEESTLVCASGTQHSANFRLNGLYFSHTPQSGQARGHLKSVLFLRRWSHAASE